MFAGLVGGIVLYRQRIYKETYYIHIPWVEWTKYFLDKLHCNGNVFWIYSIYRSYRPPFVAEKWIFALYLLVWQNVRECAYNVGICLSADKIRGVYAYKGLLLFLYGTGAGMASYKWENIYFLGYKIWKYKLYVLIKRFYVCIYMCDLMYVCLVSIKIQLRANR